MAIPNQNVMSSTNRPLVSAIDDVLHIPSVSKMTPEEIAKAVAHHNRHHPDKPGKAAQSAMPGKKLK